MRSTQRNPDDFLLDQLDLYPNETLLCLYSQISATHSTGDDRAILPTAQAKGLRFRRRALARGQ
jgi:hypothetical protein